jgi:voltage-gated potassium channel Kch
MAIVAAVCAFLVVVSTAIHYEALRGLSSGLPALRVPSRAKLLIVIFVTFLAHAAEITLYALACYALVRYAQIGGLGEPGRISLATSIYFSGETYTSLGYGDIVPVGDLRLLAGVEALNGLLLIGWSASYTYLAMERFWRGESK